MKRIRTAGPQGVVRPFVPGINLEAPDQVADALDHIARALSAIDHNVEVLANRLKDQTEAVKGLHSALNGILTALAHKLFRAKARSPASHTR